MKDQLALYRIEDKLFHRLPQMDFVEGGELAGFLERKGQHVAELMFSGGASGDILAALTTITGAPLNGLVGQSGLGVGPGGPLTFCAHIPPDVLKICIEALAEAQRDFGQAGDPDPNVRERAQRLDQLAARFGIGARLPSQLLEIQKFLERGRTGPGALVSVYTRW